MKKLQQSEGGFKLRRSVLMTASALGLTAALPTLPAMAQPTQPTFVLEEVVVTARRREERLQDVPVSMTVLNQDQMHNANITNAGDIAAYTPSLQTNSRFGSDSTNFSIRGFSQELRTTSSVGVYFAETVAPRGANTTQSGDGAGPGDFFDLENVQVLKGPQGTLFGRNTTGGAVLLTPKRPTDEFEGYIEGSLGNYDMKRVQGVVNVPVSDTLRMRFGFDQQERDGYLKNISGIGPSRFEDMDYLSLRASVVWDVTERVENYTIFKYSESETNGAPYSLFGCNAQAPTPFGVMCQQDLNRRNLAGQNGHFDVFNFVPDSKSELEQWQIINTTTIEVTENLTIKNIFSYGEVESRQNYALYGTNWNLEDFNPQLAGYPPYAFQMVGSRTDIPTTDQKTFIEEFQLQGLAFDDRLTWQAGVYWEKSRPNGIYGSYNPSQIACDPSTLGAAPSELVCFDPIGIGSYLEAPGGVTYENQAAYAQGTWEFNEQWSVTGGLRYTKDETSGWTQETVYYFDEFGNMTTLQPPRRNPSTTSEEPTWLLGVDYRPMEDVLLYAKYARGYRQGSVNLAAISEWDTHGPEKVDTYEIGAKTSFYGRFPGTFNISAFYNDFQDQQIQYGYFRDIGLGTTSILNAGKSTIWGIEAEGNVYLTEAFSVAASYAHLDTNVDELDEPVAPFPDGIAPGRAPNNSTAEGQPLSYAPRHQLVLNATYRLPVDEQIGDMSLAATYIYTSSMQGVARGISEFAVLPSYELVNFNFNWKYVMGSQVDLSAFVTNAFNEKYRTYVTGNFGDGFEYGRVGQPRMYGARIRYNF